MQYPLVRSFPRVTLLALSLTLPTFLPASADECTILDTLKGTSTSTRFSVFGTGGQGLGISLLTGPMFTLTQTTTITEIGGFLNNCTSIIGGVPQCPDPSPLIVQIRPADGGVPDLETILGTFTLTHDDDPLAVSYESAEMNLTLEPGTYFAMFASSAPDEAGFLLSIASSPFGFAADEVTLGFLRLDDGTSARSSTPLKAAVRILGECMVAVTLDIKPGSFPNVINPRSRGVIPVAVLTTADFDATRIDPETVAFGPAGAEPVHAVFKDVNADGKTDLLLHFRTEETGFTCASTSAKLSGSTQDGLSFEGIDSIRTVGCK